MLKVRWFHFNLRHYIAYISWHPVEFILQKNDISRLYLLSLLQLFIYLWLFFSIWSSELDGVPRWLSIIMASESIVRGHVLWEWWTNFWNQFCPVQGMGYIHSYHTSFRENKKKIVLKLPLGFIEYVWWQLWYKKATRTRSRKVRVIKRKSRRRRRREDKKKREKE